jgi:predicted MFS family arabinose efflux permease
MFAAILIFVGNVLAVPAWGAAAMDLAPESHRATLIGLSIALSGLALAVGSAAGGVIVGNWGAPVTLVVAAGIAALTSVGIGVFARMAPTPRRA